MAAHNMTNGTINSSISDVWLKSNGRPHGFDNLRTLLAISVILWHAIHVCHGLEAENWFWSGPFRPLVYFIVPGFFALSGFLVASSFYRNDLISFATLRFIRIYPALVFEVLLSALIIGPAVTVLSLDEYFSDSTFYKYFFNSIGWIHYHLPGTFADIPAGNVVNTQLWTIPYELESYLLIFLFGLFGLRRRPAGFLLAALAANAALILLTCTVGPLPAIEARPPGRMLVLCFIFGAALFLLRDRIPVSLPAFLAATALYSALIFHPAGIYLAPFFVAYSTVYLGLLNVRIPVLGGLSKYSYGIYLYGFPIQQVVAHAFPDRRDWWFNAGVSLILTLIPAALSWHLLERRIDQRKRRIVDAVRSLHLWKRTGGPVASPEP
ncbi:acyltransferase [Azospirillum sp. B4]|uniref:acyltransferase family protein n=1 Tax=Azospirillum sp. B4 TaxID=95605 RepID=UPI000A024FCE|nr:acyltransferase [Azospirillum sp. B4]